MTTELFADEDYMRKFMEKIPARELPEPEHIADAVVFLAGPRSDFIHGQLVPVDSGELVV
jgi:2-deoxy-D-gluconate 3-dehydrogenase